MQRNVMQGIISELLYTAVYVLKVYAKDQIFYRSAYLKEYIKEYTRYMWRMMLQLVASTYSKNEEGHIFYQSKILKHYDPYTIVICPIFQKQSSFLYLRLSSDTMYMYGTCLKFQIRKYYQSIHKTTNKTNRKKPTIKSIYFLFTGDPPRERKSAQRKARNNKMTKDVLGKY